MKKYKALPGDFTKGNEEVFKELLEPLTSKYKKELMKKLEPYASRHISDEITFSNYSVVLVARRMLELFFQHNYNYVPFVFIEPDGKTLCVDWNYKLNVKDKTELLKL